MSHTIPIQQASAQLGQLVRSLGPDDEIILMENDRPVARIVPNSPNSVVKRRVPGAWKGMLEIIDDRDDVILEHFKD
jgi:antitoxin (DNA-binding transcriptional repressor) of toxin-antitoxin stability system